MNDVNYRQNEKGGWDIYIDDTDFGVSLYIPSGHRPEDYNITFNFFKVGESTVLPMRKCVNVAIELLNRPETTKEIYFDQTAGVHFVDNLMLCIREGLRMQGNDRLVVGASVDHSPDGFRRVTINYLNLALNSGTSITFCKRESEKELSEPPLKKLTPNILNGYIERNKNIDYTLVDSGGILFIANNEYKASNENKYKNLSVNLDADHSIFIYNNFDCPDKKSKANDLSIKADTAQWVHTMCHIYGENKIIVEPLNEKKPTLLTTSAGVTFNTINATMKAKTNELALLNDGALHTLEISGDISLLGKKEINVITSLKNISLRNSTIENQYGPLNLTDSTIHRVNAQLSNGNNKRFFINNSVITDSTIKGHQGDIVSSNLSRVTMNNSKFEKGAEMIFAKKLDIKFNSKNTSEYWVECQIDNLELKENSVFKIGDPSKPIIWPKDANYTPPPVNVLYSSIKNTVVSGNSNISGFPLSELNNSILESANLYCSLPEVKINNTILKNSSSLDGISEISNSEIDNSHITAKKPTAINGQFLQKEKIKDYENFVGKSDQNLANDISYAINEMSLL
jgi:hypothetical protein